MTTTLRTTLRVLIHMFTVTALSLCFLIPKSRYDWIRDVAPDIDPATFDDGSGNRILVLVATIFLAILLEGIAVATARNRRERVIGSALAALLILTALLRLS